MEGALPDLPRSLPPLSVEVAPMASLMSDSSSDLSSPLSRSPTPPPEIYRRIHGLPSPPSSQQSSRGTPCPDGNSSTCASSAEDEDSRPTKRRRVTPSMPRDTKRLDLHELYSRPDPEQQAELDRLLKVLRKNRKIVVVAGAGISVSAGIPDFRSSTGLFNSLKSQHNLKGSGKELFDAAVYRDSSSTSSFHDMVRSLSDLTKSAKPTPFHHLLARLAHEGRLLRLYSQNVDGIDTSLEPLATQVPLPAKAPWPKTIQLHGGLEKMICTKCQQLSDFKADLFDGPIPPECPQCKEHDFARTEVAGKRSHGIGRLRPRMVLYNEHNPDDEAIGAVTKADLRRRPDAVIVVGTTLKIPGVKRIVREMCSIVRNHRDGLAVWINNDPEPAAKEFESCWDLIIKGTCDEVAEHAAMRKWDDDDIGDAKVVTEEEVQLAKAASQPQVVLHTPTKPLPIKDIEGLPTPVHTPRHAGSTTSGESDQQVVLPLKATNEITSDSSQPLKPKTGKQSTIGRPKVAAGGARARQPKKADSGQDGSKKSATATKKQPAANSKLSFKVKKPTTSATATGNEKPATGECIKLEHPLKSEVLIESPNPPSITYANSLGIPIMPAVQINKPLEMPIATQFERLPFQTPKKAKMPLERPPVSPFTPARPVPSPFTDCKKQRGPLILSPSRDYFQVKQSRFPGLVKAPPPPDFSRA